jgi:alpha-ketoglutarate-dependent taurine dioxygenase
MDCIRDFSETFSPGVRQGVPAFLTALAQQREDILRCLDISGGVLIRGTPLTDLGHFKEAVLTLDKNVMEYTGAKVRRNLCDNIVYSPTSTPARRINFLHHEMAYQKVIPSRLAFMCATPAPQGGESLLADSRELYKKIPPQIRQEMETRGLLFQRVFANRTRWQNYLSQKSDLFALAPSWQGNWNTDDAEEAHHKAEAQGLSVRWTKEKHMVLACQISPVRQHPQTGESLWVNNAHLFQLHKKVFGKRLYYLFKTFFALTGIPMTTCYFGDGQPIPADYVSEILDATFAVQKTLPLRRGDLIFINNITVAHGRLPFRGPRRLYFAAYK